MEKYCVQCDKDEDFIVLERNETYDIRGENIQVKTGVLKCGKCGLEFFDDAFTGSALREAYNEYRRRKNIPSPDEIKELRHSFGLSQREFAKLLGWGYVTVSRYENGSLPGESHAAVLAALKHDPEHALGLLEATKNNFEEDDLANIKEKLSAVSRQKTEARIFREVQRPKVSVYTGFKLFDMEKLKNAILFFASLEPNLLKTKLLKLLWYSDFLSFKRHGIGITGTTYVHLPLGPVPDNYSLMLGILQEAGYIKIEPIIKKNHPGELVKPVSCFPDNYFSQEELETIKEVQKKFQSWGSRRISDYSHSEEAYKNTVEGEKISYHFAENLSLD